MLLYRGRGSGVAADLSSTLIELKIQINDDGADWTLKLPEDKSNGVNLDVASLNTKVKILGSIDCTGKYYCFLRGGSEIEECTEDCATELVVEGSVVGNVFIASNVPTRNPDEYTGNATVVITTTEPDGCEHFYIYDDDGVPFDCNNDAEATVQLEAFPCTVATGEGGPMDVLQCQGETWRGENTCNCVVSGGVCPSPSPTPSPTSSSSTCAIMFVVHVVTSAVGVLALVW